MRITIPTGLTLFRILLLPVMVVVFYAPFHGANVAVAIIFISGVTRIWAGAREGWSVLVYGTILVLCIMFMRNGLVGVWNDTMRLIRNRRRKPNAVGDAAARPVP